MPPPNAILLKIPLFLAFGILLGCKDQIEEVTAEKAIEELIDKKSIATHLKFELESVQFSKGGNQNGSSQYFGSKSERSSVNLIIGKDNQLLMEVEKLKPTLYENVRHETPVDPNYREVQSLKLVNNTYYAYDQNKKLLHSESQLEDVKIKEALLLFNDGINSYSLLNQPLNALTNERINSISDKRSVRLSSNNGQVVKFTKSLSSQANARSSNEGIEELNCYYNAGNGLLKGYEVLKNGQPMSRCAYKYKLVGENASLELIHHVDYIYDDNGQKIDEIVTNTYIKTI